MRTRLVGNTHLVTGGPENVADILTLLKDEGIGTQGDPDFYVRTYRQFGIEEARELRERASLRALGERRIFVVAAPDMNREAQNALLKTLEEPPGNALFIFILPSPETLLPTLRSRMQILVLKGGKKRDALDAKQFLAVSPKERLDILKPLFEKGDDDKRDLGAILSFLSSLERALEISKGREVGGRQGLRAIYRARAYMTDKGALVKPLLEQVALLAPRV